MNATGYEWADSEFADYLNEAFEPVTLFGCEYAAGDAIRELDPTAFRCMMADCQRWECEECGNVFDEEDAAEECCAQPVAT